MKLRVVLQSSTGAVDGGEQGLGVAPHLGIAAGGQPVGDQGRRREDVAQIVIDLADRAAQSGEPGLLAEGGAQARLHLHQLMLGDPDLVLALAGLDGGREILRIVAEGDHRLGQAAHRAGSSAIAG